MSKIIVIVIIVCVNSLFASTPVDSLQAGGVLHFHSIGFNASSLSGLGLSYRNKLSESGLFQFTGGMIDADGRTNYSFGLEYQYQLSKRPTFRYYLSAGLGSYSDSQTTEYAGFGIGLEVPIVGPNIFEGVTCGGCLFYPALNLSRSPRISVGGSLYLFYNF